MILTGSQRFEKLFKKLLEHYGIKIYRESIEGF